jgi:hypothetical protein
MSNNNRRIDSTIIAAVIGVMGTLCVTVISLYANYFAPRLQPTAVGQPTDPALQVTWTAPATSTIPPTTTITNTPVPTDTVPAGDPTSTPAPETPTPEPSLTPVPPAIGADWANGCVSSLWRLYPETVQATVNNGCISQPVIMSIEQVNLFFTENGSLKFAVSRIFDSAQVYGLFAPIPANGLVRIDTLLRRVQEGEIWMGVFAEPNLTSQGLVAVIPENENMKRMELVQIKMPERTELNNLENFAEDSSQDPPRYSIVFQLSNGEVKLQSLRDTEFSPVLLNSAQPWLFIGYQVLPGNNRIDGEFLNLLIQQQ